MRSKRLSTYMCLVVALSLLAPVVPMATSADARAQQTQNLAIPDCVRDGGWGEPVTDDCE